MQRRRELMAMLGVDSMVGIKQSAVTMTESSGTITFPVESKPWGLLVSCDNDDAYYGGTAAKRLSTIWSEYNGGSYVGGRITVMRGSTPDHFNLPASSFAYDSINGTFTISTTVASFVSGETYYLWYFTIPF